MKLLLPALALALLISLPGCGGTKEVVWQYLIDAGGDETASSLAGDGTNLYVGATSVKGDKTSWLVVKLSNKGKPIWTRMYKDAPYSVCEDVTADSSGTCYAVGRVKPADKTACLVVKYGYDGSIAWQKGLELGEKSWGMGVTLVGKDKIAVCGVAGSDANSDHLVALLDAKDGHTVWLRNYDICCTDLAVRIAADAKGNLAVVGQHDHDNQPDIIVLKLGPNGDTLWTRTYDSGGRDEAGDIAFDPFGNVIVTGTAVVGDSTRCIILEYDPDGSVIRKAAYGQQAQADGNGIYVNAASDIFVAGRLLGVKQADGVPRSEILVFQYNPSAISIWERQYSPGGNADGVDLVVPDDAYVAANVTNKTADAVVYRFSRPVMPKVMK